MKSTIRFVLLLGAVVIISLAAAIWLVAPQIARSKNSNGE